MGHFLIFILALQMMGKSYRAEHVVYAMYLYVCLSVPSVWSVRRGAGIVSQSVAQSLSGAHSVGRLVGWLVRVVGMHVPCAVGCCLRCADHWRAITTDALAVCVGRG